MNNNQQHNRQPNQPQQPHPNTQFTGFMIPVDYQTYCKWVEVMIEVEKWETIDVFEAFRNPMVHLTPFSNG